MDTLLFNDVVVAWDQAVLLIERDGTISGWNPAAERLFGHAAAEVAGLTVDALFAFNRREEVRQILDRIAGGGGVERHDTMGMHRDGRSVPVSLAVAPVSDESGRVLGASVILRDITRFRNSEENFRLVVEASPSGMLLVDRAGTITLVNAEIERIFGYGRSELVGAPLDALVPASRRPGHAGLRTGFEGSQQTRRMGSGRLITGLRKDGAEVHIEVALTPLMTSAGPVTLAVVVDVSEREALLQQLEAQAVELRRSNEELTQFAYVASHDLQEPLRMVASFAELLDERSRAHLDEKGLKYLGYVTEGARRMQQLVRDLLAYSRLGTQGRPMASVDLSRVAQRVVDDLALAIRSSGATVDIGPLPTVQGDEGQLGQLLQNLVGNALKFRGEAAPRVSITATSDGSMCHVAVADNGIGIDMKYHDRVFEMFQRLHGRGQFEGSGIGLAIVRRVVQRHGGTVWFESAPGAGTCFHFTLPPARTLSPT